MDTKTTEKAKDEEQPATLKKQFFKAVCIQWFSAVVAHTMNLQSEAILMRNACKGDLGKAARLLSVCNAITGLLGLIVNQMGGKLSDSLGRKFFYLLGPFVQVLAGLMTFTRPDSTLALATGKVLRGIFTTFSGTVMGSAGMRDTFKGQELGVMTAKGGSVIGLGIMVGPLIEGAILKRFKTGGERISFLGLSVLGSLGLLLSIGMPETLSESKRAKFNFDAALASANPFGFLKIFTKGTPAVKKLCTIATLQTMIDGKSMSDLSQIWMREHLKLSVEGIRNFVVSFGFLSVMSGAKLTPGLLKNLSVSGFTALTNGLNFLAFTVRGLAESAYLYFGCLPFMLPGVNGASNAAIVPVMNEHMVSCGFGVGESSAWFNNLRVLMGVVSTLIYGYWYAWCRKAGVNPGTTYALAGLCGAAIPQLLFSSLVKDSELQVKKDKTP